MADLFVSGRLCLFGEHSDWAGSYRSLNPDLPPGQCIVTGTDQGLRARATRLAGALEITSVLPDGSALGPMRLPVRGAPLRAVARAGGFFSYAAGAAVAVTDRVPVGGLRLEITHADLPVRKGLSSSAAVCVLVARAYNDAYHLGWSPADEMEVAYEGEHHAGSACGRMDQVCALGHRLSLLTFDGPGMEIDVVSPGATFWLLVVDLDRTKDTRRILDDLRRCYPDAPGPMAAGVRDALGRKNADMVGAARRALEAGDARTVGGLMSEAQSLFDDAVVPASRALVAPQQQAVLRHPAVRELAWGGKGVGSQGGGCCQLVAKGPEERTLLTARLSRTLGLTSLPCTIGPRAPAT
jgi:galactokinase